MSHRHSPLQSRMVTSMPKRFSTPLNSDDPFAPLILMSGYMVKRTRGLVAKWQKRYWQLLGDGTLIYFAGEHRVKVLGEIDIAHTCYEVRHGSENCEVKFPPVVEPKCCLSVAVLKRTYYFYTYTEEEAKQWVEALSSTSYVINRMRPRSLNCSPAIQVAMEALQDKEPSPPPPPSTQPPPSHKPPPPPPIEENDSFDENSSEDEHNDQPAELPNFTKLSHGGHRNMSVPDLRFDVSNITHNGSWIDGSPRIRFSEMSHSTTPSSSATGIKVSTHHAKDHQRRKKTAYTSSPTGYTSQFSPKKPPSVSTLKQKYMSQGNLLDNGTSGITTLPSPSKLARMKHQWRSEYDASWSPAFEKLEQLQQQEDAIRKRIEEMKKADTFSYLSNRGVPVLPYQLPTVEKGSLSQSAVDKLDSQPGSPDYHSQPAEADVDMDTLGELKKFKHAQKVPKKPPKPAVRRPTPAFAHSVQPLRDVSNEVEVRQQHDCLPNQHMMKNISILDSQEDEEGSFEAMVEQQDVGHQRNENMTGSKALEANIWVKRELKKVL